MLPHVHSTMIFTLFQTEQFFFQQTEPFSVMFLPFPCSASLYRAEEKPELSSKSCRRIFGAESWGKEKPDVRSDPAIFQEFREALDIREPKTIIAYLATMRDFVTWLAELLGVCG